jgi:hypothetical protein
MIDQSMLTGDSLPIDVEPGASVYAGALVRRGQTIDDDVPEVDADTQQDAPILRSPAAAAVILFCNSTAHSTALTALANSTSIPSPITLTTRPW